MKTAAAVLLFSLIVFVGYVTVEVFLKFAEVLRLL